MGMVLWNAENMSALLTTKVKFQHYHDTHSYQPYSRTIIILCWRNAPRSLGTRQASDTDQLPGSRILFERQC